MKIKCYLMTKNWLCENHHHCTLWSVILNYRCDRTPCLWANQSLFSLAWIDHFWTIFWFIKTLSFSVSLLPLEPYFLSRLINLIRYEYKVVSENTFTLNFFCMIVHDQMVMFNLIWNYKMSNRWEQALTSKLCYQMVMFNLI